MRRTFNAIDPRTGAVVGYRTSESGRVYTHAVVFYGAAATWALFFPNEQAANTASRRLFVVGQRVDRKVILTTEAEPELEEELVDVDLEEHCLRMQELEESPVWRNS